MRILISLTYYRPHISGLTLYNQRLAEGLADRGHRVTVLTSRYSKKLPMNEVRNGVEIRRVPVWFRISKGVFMPALPFSAWSVLRSHDVVLLNLPNTPLESFFVPTLSKILGKRILAVFHCDVRLPGGIWNRMVEIAVRASSFFALLLSDRLIGYTEDYLSSIGFLKGFRKKAAFILPPIAVENPDAEKVAQFRSRHALGEQTSIGFAGRLASEKGVEDIVQALPIVQEVFPHTQLLFAGDFENVIGERDYHQRLKNLFDELDGRHRFLGVLEPDEMPSFYACCAATVLCSRNRTESFGLVQVESMFHGAPVIASNLPGVRVPVQKTGMGLLVSPGDLRGLAEAIIEILSNRERYVRPRNEIEEMFSLEHTLDSFEDLLE